MIKKEPRPLAGRQRLAVDHDAIAFGDIKRGGMDDVAIDRNAPGSDPFLGLTARGEPGARDHLGDAFARLVAFALVVHSRSGNNAP